MAVENVSKELLEEEERLQKIKLERKISDEISKSTEELHTVVAEYVRVEGYEANRIKAQVGVIEELRVLYNVLSVLGVKSQRGGLSAADQKTFKGVNSSIAKYRGDFLNNQKTLRGFKVELAEIDNRIHLTVIALNQLDNQLKAAREAV